MSGYIFRDSVLFWNGRSLLQRAQISHWWRKSQKNIPKQMSKASVASVQPARPSSFCLLEFRQARKQLGPASVLPSASGPFGRERWDLLTDWLPFRDHCSTNRQPTRSRKPGDEDDKLCPGPQRRGGEEWLTNPCILWLRSKNCLPWDLNHSLRATPDQAAEEGQQLFAGWVWGPSEGPGWKWILEYFFGQVFWIGRWPWLPLGTRQHISALKGHRV